MVKEKIWFGNPPMTCDICSGPLKDGKFVDGKTSGGPWGCMCTACHKTNGVGLGLGKGQQYQKRPDGTWVKIAG